MIKVLIVEEQRLLRDGIEAIIERTNDIQVTGTADNGDAAIGQMEHLEPDVVIMDVQMPHMDGIRTANYIKENYAQVKVVMLTATADDDLVISAINVGVDGFLLKALYAERLIDAIRMAYQGEVVISGEVARVISNKIRELTMDKKQIFTIRLERLGYEFTKREIDIAYLLMENNTNRQIAARLYLSEGTVKNYISGIYNKLDTRNRTKTINILNDLLNKKLY